MKKKLTAAEIIVKYLINEGIPYILGIFGHGNVQLAQAIKENEDKITYIQVKNEQNAVHIASAYARFTKKPLAITTSIGPGCTNLVTGAAAAKTNGWPVLLLPGESFSDASGPVLQQPEGYLPDDVLASNCLKPVSKYWIKISRPEELMKRLPEAFEAMLEPGNEGPAVIAIPMDSQAFSYEYDLNLLLKQRYNKWKKIMPDRNAIKDAIEIIKEANRPFIIAGGGIIKSMAWKELEEFSKLICAPVAQTHAGYGALLFENDLNVYSTGPDGALCGNRLAKKADLIIGIGTRYMDFVDCSETLFESAENFININIRPFDVVKRRAIKIWGDAKISLKMLINELKKDMRWRNFKDYRETNYYKEIQKEREKWIEEINRWLNKDTVPMIQARVIGIVNEMCDEKAVIVSAAGSLPGHLLRLWKCKDPTRLGFFCEYGYSTMGFEIPGAIGAKLAFPEREVYAMIGDASFLMQPQELVTAVQEKIPIIVILIDNKGPQVIRNLQRVCGFDEFGNEFKYRDKNGKLEGYYMEIDYAKIAEGMGCNTYKVKTSDELKDAIIEAKSVKNKPTLIHVITEPGREFLPCYEGWWNVPIPEVTKNKKLKEKLKEYKKMLNKRKLL